MSSLAMADEVKVSDVNAILDQADKLAKDIKLPDNFDKEGMKAAQEAYQTFQSDNIQAKIKEEKDSLLNNEFKEVLESKDIEALKKLGDGERIYIFISSSIPVETIRNYIKTIDAVNDPRICLVMRGFIGDVTDMKKTLTYIRSLLMKNPACNDMTCQVFKSEVLIDPMLFRLYDVKAVPSIVYAKNVFITDPEKSEGSLSNADGLKISGDISLQYALEKMAEKTESQTIKDILNQMKGSFYNGQKG